MYEFFDSCGIFRKNENAKSNKKPPQANQRMLTAFFSAKKVEVKVEKPPKKPKFYTDVDPVVPRLFFTKVSLTFLARRLLAS